MASAHPSEEEVQMFLTQALYQQATGLTQTALDTVAKISSIEGMDPLDLKTLAAVQLQGCDYNAVNRTLAGQEDIMSLMLRGKAEFGLG